MPLHIFASNNAELDCSSDVYESCGEGVAPVSCCICEEAIGESSRARCSRHGPEGNVKAARQFTIAPQQGEGDWKTSIRQARKDVKWLGPISPRGVQTQERHLWTRETNDDSDQAGEPPCKRRLLEAQMFSPLHKSLPQLKSMQKHQANLWFSSFESHSECKENGFKVKRKGGIGTNFN